MLGTLAVLAVIGISVPVAVAISSSGGTHATASQTGSASAASARPSTRFDTSAHSLSDPTSDWVVVNKERPLSPAEFAPRLASISVGDAGGALKLRPEAASKLDAMAAAFQAETGESLESQSDYRPYASQVRVYNGWVASKGKAQADLQSARPGYSEHQTGLAVDLVGSTGGCGLDACFATTTAGRWLSTNAYRWGFILRYPDGKTAITGYEFEPWHYRYVGIALASEMHTTGIATMEEFFHLSAAPDYP